MPRWPATKTRLPARSNGGEATPTVATRPPAATEPAVGLVLAGDLLEVGRDHLLDQIGEGRARAPAQTLARLARVAQQVVDLERAEVARVDLDQDLAGAAVEPLLLDALAPPDDLAAGLGEGELDELAHGVGFAGRQHPVVGGLVLEDAPHALDIVAGMAPVAPGVEIAEPQAVLQPELDRGHRAADLAGDEGLAAAGGSRG